MKTIMHLLSMNSLSGAEKVAINIIKNLESKDFHFVYVSPDGPIRDLLLNEEIHYIPIKKLSIFEIRKAIMEVKPDIIHTHDNRASVLTAVSVHTIPIISHLHSNPQWMNKICLKTLIYRICVKRFNFILTVSETISKDFIAIRNMKNVLNIYNPINSKLILEKADEFYPEKSDLIFCGRLSSVKNPLLFLRIVAEIKKSYPDIKACIVGNGELKEECENFIDMNNLNSNVKLIGFVSNPYPYIKQSHILCSTSDYEGFGLVAAEAMCLGLPVVATQSGGVQEINKHLLTGFNCINIKEFVEAISELLADENLYKQMSNAAKAHMYDFEKNNNYYVKLLNIYQYLI